MIRAFVLAIFVLFIFGRSSEAQPETVVDLATVSNGDQLVFRAYGADGNGAFGVPVAGGHDVDGDGIADMAVAFMTVRSGGVELAGEVDLIFGRSVIDGQLDTAVNSSAFLRIIGSVVREAAGAEIWMDDVTGDGLGDLLVCRQNYTLGSRCGAGALSIIEGGAGLRTAAATLQPVDLENPPAGVTVTTIIGQNSGDRLCVWARTGDVDGDSVADIAVGADQEDIPGEINRGAVYVFRGGAHLGNGQTYDLTTWGSSAREGNSSTASGGSHPLDGLAAKMLPPANSENFHLGGTVQVADLDDNGRAEVLMAATLNRAGASLPPQSGNVCFPNTSPMQSSGGSDRGTVYIAWDDNFPAAPTAWPDGYTFDVTAAPGSRTIIDGELDNDFFGEEMLGGADLDGDGQSDLFIGDLVADGTPTQDQPGSGLGHVLFDAATLKGLTLNMEVPPAPLVFSRIVGPRVGALTADTAAIGDVDGDGLADLIVSSPHDDPLGRQSAGSTHVLYGRQGAWPSDIDLTPGELPPTAQLRVAEIQGALGTSGSDTGDTLGYSVAAGDIDGDGRSDVIINEMVGNGLGVGTVDVGNLLVISGRALDPALIFTDGFESADTDRWTQTIERSAAQE